MLTLYFKFYFLLWMFCVYIIDVPLINKNKTKVYFLLYFENSWVGVIANGENL
jgi:hypothetical protein